MTQTQTETHTDTPIQRKLIDVAQDAAGFSASEVTGHSPEHVRRAAEALVKAGRLVRYNVSPRRVRYFATLEAAQKYQIGKSPVAGRSGPPGGGSGTKARWSPDEPGRITAKTRITIVPPPTARVYRTNTYTLY
jgi:hypothetical protein